MLKPQIFEHPHFLPHHEARLKSELKGFLCAGLAWVWLDVDAAGKGVVVDDGNNDLQICHFFGFFVIISNLIFTHNNLLKHPTSSSYKISPILHIFQLNLDNGLLSGVQNELIAIINIKWVTASRPSTSSSHPTSASLPTSSGIPIATPTTFKSSTWPSIMISGELRPSCSLIACRKSGKRRDRIRYSARGRSTRLEFVCIATSMPGSRPEGQSMASEWSKQEYKYYAIIQYTPSVGLAFLSVGSMKS